MARTDSAGHGFARALKRYGRPRTLARMAVRAVRGLSWYVRSVTGARVTVATGHGLLTLDPSIDRGPISRRLYCNRAYELRYIAIVLEFLRSTDRLPPVGTGTFVNVGANIGSTAIAIFRRGEFARGVAIEPAPANARLLRHNVGQNGLIDRLLTIEAACAEEPGTRLLVLNSENGGAHRLRPLVADVARLPREDAQTPVRAAMLDDLLAEAGVACADVALIWMDVQAYEARVIAGAARTLSRGVPTVVEIWPRGMERAGIPPSELFDIASKYWRAFGLRRKRTVEMYPIARLPALFDKLHGGGKTNAIFLP